MYAVIRTGGKQYKVAAGDKLEVEHLPVKGKQVTFTPILVVTDDGKSVYGRKDLKPYSVVAKILGDAKGDKVEVFKYRSKSGYAKKTGHRQLLSSIEIVSIGTRETPRETPRETKPAEKKEEPEEVSAE